MSSFTAIVVARIEVVLDMPESTLRSAKKTRILWIKNQFQKTFFELFRKKFKNLCFQRDKNCNNFFSSNFWTLWYIGRSALFSCICMQLHKRLFTTCIFILRSSSSCNSVKSDQEKKWYSCHYKILCTVLSFRYS